MSDASALISNRGQLALAPQVPGQPEPSVSPRHRAPTPWQTLPPLQRSLGRRLIETSLAMGAPLPIGDVAAVIAARAGTGSLTRWEQGDAARLLQVDLPTWCSRRRMAMPPRSAETIWYLLLEVHDAHVDDLVLPPACDELLALAGPRSTAEAAKLKGRSAHPAGGSSPGRSPSGRRVARSMSGWRSRGPW